MEESWFDIQGEKFAVANATLAPGLSKKSSQYHKVYASADGSGVHRNPVTARHIAISEALERWAHYQLWNSEDRSRYGFDIDPTSNGMSAFPGLFSSQARSYAYLEAVERYTLFSWWEGLTEAVPLHDPDWKGDAWYLPTPFPGHVVALVRQRDPEMGFPCYGYGSGKNKNQALNRAIIELERSRFVLTRFFEKNPCFECGDLSILNDFLEKRLVYFALPEGEATFEKRINKRPTGRPPIKPELIFDGEVPGPWSKFATVWRVAYKMPSKEYLSPQSMYFFW